MINILKAKLTRQQIGVKIEEETISMIRFADDIVIITENEGDEQKKFLCYVNVYTIRVRAAALTYGLRADSSLSSFSN